MKTYLRKTFSRLKRLVRGVRFPLKAYAVGVSRPDFQGALVQTREDDELQLVHAPSESDPLAVYIYNIQIGALLGKLSKKLSKDLIFCFGKGFCLDGQVIAVTGGRRDKRGCSLVVYDTSEFLKDEILPMVNE